MHPRNLHNDSYNFDDLAKSVPNLAAYIRINPRGTKTIDFANPNAVKALNKALLKTYYNIEYWDIPKGYLCPPVPGRADYIHALADLIGFDSKKATNTQTVRGLDIGSGANLIYPILGRQIYGWHFVASDIDDTALKSASLICQTNKSLLNAVEIKKQVERAQIFKNIVQSNDQFDFCMCNPPFHKSQREAMQGNSQKRANLAHNRNKRKTNQTSRTPKPELNFAGKSNELWCEGGELRFITRMVQESTQYKNQINWFTCLVSKKSNLSRLTKELDRQQVIENRVVNMSQGSKISRFIAWRY